MAAKDSNGVTRKFLGDALEVRPDATRAQLADHIDMTLSCLVAQINSTFGVNGASFRGINDDLQDSFLWGIANQIDTLKICWEQYGQLDVDAEVLHG